MPGGGKTTACATLAELGYRVVGEYTTPTGNTVPVGDYPADEDDDAHQQNWLTKHQQASTDRRHGNVLCDRDWLTSLAYAASLDDHTLLTARCRWACHHLTHGQLAVAGTYVVVHISPDLSLQRRTDRLTPGHPWNEVTALQRLHRFYYDPPAALGSTLGDLLARADWHHLQTPDPPTLVRHLRALVERP